MSFIKKDTFPAYFQKYEKQQLGKIKVWISRRSLLLILYVFQNMLHNKDTNASFNTILTKIYFQKLIMCIPLRRIPFSLKAIIFKHICKIFKKKKFWLHKFGTGCQHLKLNIFLISYFVPHPSINQLAIFLYHKVLQSELSLLPSQAIIWVTVLMFIHKSSEFNPNFSSTVLSLLSSIHVTVNNDAQTTNVSLRMP